MNSKYWPSEKEIDLCIRTEAEELSDATLLSVHESMVLSRRPVRDSKGSPVTEAELLEHVVKTNRPTPIIGESGFGKSHAIRWLHAQLRARKDCEAWHIVRIPKNASLRNALTHLLEGLEGEVFEEARKKIDLAGEQLKTRDVAEHLVVFTNARMEELYQDAKDAQPEELEDSYVRVIRRHAKRSGLPALLGDTNFKKQIIEEGRCFYQIAKRLTQGSSDEEIEENNFEVILSDLSIEDNIQNFSLDAKTYVQRSRLNTSEDVRKEVVDLLNECLGDACRKTFQQLFQFTGGSFQDLFRDIRKHLMADGKTLCILVEDMAAISAIEDILIDSLMEEDTREGVQELCRLHSAIAVTTGYQGYARRRDTLATRAKYEWFIERSLEDENSTLRRIENFCGRYLNAARHGEEQLRKMYASSDAATFTIDIWQSADNDEEQQAAVFGESSEHFPLFPFNGPSLKALAYEYCRPRDELEFNPRKILQHILREPLSSFRNLYCAGEFPPIGFALLECPISLKQELRQRVRDDLARAETMAAIWGYGANTLGELAAYVSAEMAKEFGLEGLASAIEGVDAIPPPPADPPGPAGPPTGSIVTPQPVSGVDEAFAISQEVDGFFANKSIPQNPARLLRNALLEALERKKTAWYGIENWPVLKKPNKQPLIYIPYSDNQPANTLLSFGSEKIFGERDQALPYQQFLVAVLRHEKSASGDWNDWSYPTGFEDYCNYNNFIDAWTSDALTQLVSTQHKYSEVSVLERIGAAKIVDPSIDGRQLVEKIDCLVQTREMIGDHINVATGLEDWDIFLEGYLYEWDDRQSEWLGSFSTNRHALEGDLVKSILRGSGGAVIPPKAAKAAQQASIKLQEEFQSLGLLEGCATQEEYQTTLAALLELIGRLSSESQFKGMNGIVTVQTLKNRIGRVIESQNWNSVKNALQLIGPFAADAAISALHSMDTKALMVLNQILENWTQVYDANYQRLVNENEESGAGRRKEVETNLGRLIAEFGVVLEVEGEVS